MSIKVVHTRAIVAINNVFDQVWRKAIEHALTEVVPDPDHSLAVPKQHGRQCERPHAPVTTVQSSGG